MNMMRNEKPKSKYESRTVSIRPVTKVTAGGRRMRLSALVVIGDRKGRVGLGLGRAMDLRGAVEKGTNIAEKNLIKVDLVGGTIPHEITYKYRGARILLKPAKPGTGIIAGSSVRTVLELLGVDDVYAKQMGSSDQIANAYCVYEALQHLKSDRVLKKMKSMQARVDMKIKEEQEKARKRKLESHKKRSRSVSKKVTDGKKINKKKEPKSKKVSKPVNKVSKVKKDEKSSTKKDK